ncbi:MAG: preprotein translocase subunit SecE [Rhodobacteraceae bacterium]|nr:MAG: preprotein translocase subunit SecE [Paracoccaceae bacterium]
MINPFAFIQQVRSEADKITWPTRRETLTTTIMVFIMASLFATFFFLIDSIVSFGLRLILAIAS